MTSLLAQVVDPSWVDIASKFGLPVVILAAVFWAGARILKWIGAEVVVPLRDRMIKFLDDHTNWMLKLQSDQRLIADENTRHHAWEEECMDEMHDKITKIGQSKGFDWADPQNNGNTSPKKTMKANLGPLHGELG